MFLTRLLGSPLRNLLAGVTFELVVMLTATFAYVGQGWRAGDAIYMVVLTVFTVGFDEVRPIDTTALRAITIALIVFGCTGMIFLTGAFVQLITVSQFQQIFGLRRMQRDIDQLTGHVIVCGFGRIGQMLARDLRVGRAAVVVVERSAERAAAARDLGYLTLEGDAADEVVLGLAGIVRARCLATVLPDDAANVFITLSARSLNRALTIVSRGEAPTTERKLIHAGADHVVLPAYIGAERIAEIVLYPDTAQLLSGPRGRQEVAKDLGRLGLELEVATVEAGSACDGMTVESLERMAAGAFLVVALNRRDGASLTQPPAATKMEAGDGVALVGRPGRAQALNNLFGSSRSVPAA